MHAKALSSLLYEAIAARRPLLDDAHLSALRLFNGFTEGCRDLVIELYADTAVLHNYADPPAVGEPAIAVAQEVLQATFPWLKAGVVKLRSGKSQHQRRGTLVFGTQLATQIQEHDLLYAVDLTLHQDCSFYLDTRNLRRWAMEHLRGLTVLNTFAYTGSLGVAALGGGAARVVQLDRNQRFLDIARASCHLNRLAADRRDFIRADFFRETGRLRRLKRTFDCVFLDPPFFASASTGTVDQESQAARVINKVRPLVAPEGYLAAINNALYVSGAAYLRLLESLCSEGYMEIVELIPVPEDFIGWGSRQQVAPITDPTPFNHSTKIAVLRVRPGHAT